jgi:hypothetical protein
MGNGSAHTCDDRRPARVAGARQLQARMSRAFRPSRQLAAFEPLRSYIALTDAVSGICQGVVLCPGRQLSKHFVYVADQSFKCQRAIPMAFFDQFDGRSVFNPPYP